MSTPREKNTTERISYATSRTSIAISDMRTGSTATAGPSLRDASSRGLDGGAGDDDITNADIVSNATTSRVNSNTFSFPNFTPAFHQASEAGKEGKHPRAPRWDDDSMEAGGEVEVDDEDAAGDESYSSYRRGNVRDHDASRANRRSGTSWSGGYRFYGAEEKEEKEKKEFRGYGGGSVFRDEEDDSAFRHSYEHDMEKFDLADNLQRQAESRNVRHYHKTKAVHLPGGGSSGGYGDSGQSKSHESMKGRNSGGGGIEGGDRGWVEGGLWEGKGSGRGRSEGGSGRCSKSKESTMRLKSKQRTKARDRGAKKKAEDDICLTSLAGREKDEKGQNRKERRRSRSTTSMAGLEKSPSNSDAVIAKNQMEFDFANGGKQGAKGFSRSGRGRRGGSDRVTDSRHPLLSPASDGRPSEQEGWRCHPAGVDDLFQSRIKKKDKRPLDSHVKTARITLAKSLRLGGRSILLSGLCLRYHENITILLEDAALALEDGLFRQPQARKGSRSRSREGSKNSAWNDWWTADLPPWVTAWAPELKVVDLSQNQLKGINPLLIVRVRGAPEGDAGASATSADGKNVSEKACTHRQPGPFVDAYPMRNVEELHLNGNLLHSVPPDMHLALPNLKKLELYGNLIEGIRMPEGQLPRLKHLNLGYNNLVELPSDISAVMPNLEELLLPNNCLERLPNEIAALKHLKRLDVSHNPLTSPPLEVAARGVDAVKRYFRDIEAQDRVKEREVQVEVPNQLKVIVVGHRDAGKSELIKCLSSMPSGEPEPPEVPRTPRPDVPPVEGSDRQTFQTTFVSNPRTNLENIQGSRPTHPSANTPPLARRPYSGGVRQECSLPDTPEVNISTWEHTPTVRTRKHLHDGVDDRGGNQTAAASKAAASKAAASKAALTAETEDCPSLSGVSVEDVRSGNITLKLWDFGGTDEFHAVHGLFFSRRALYTVVFDLHYVEKNEINKRVQFWVDCIQTRVPGAHILLVGTHADQMGEADAKERCHRVLEQIQDNEKCIVRGIERAGDRGSQAARGLSHPKSRPQIEAEVVAVSCDTQEKGFQAFREQVLRLAGDPKHFTTSRLPAAWVEVDRLVKERRSQGYSIMKVEELVDRLNSSSTNMTATTANDYNKEDSRNIVASTLNWLNDTSEVVFFDKPQLDEFVILHPLRLMQAIKLIVSVDLKKKVRDIVQDSFYAAEERDHVETSVMTQTPTRKKGAGLVTTPPATATPASSASGKSSNRSNRRTPSSESAKRVSGQNGLRCSMPLSASSPQSHQSITTSPPAPPLLAAASGSPQVSTPLSGDFVNGGGRDDGRVGDGNRSNKKLRHRRRCERRRDSPQATAAEATAGTPTSVSADGSKRQRRRRGKGTVGHRAIGNDPPSSSTAAVVTVAVTGTAEDQATPSPQAGNPPTSPEDRLSNSGIVTHTLSDTALSPAGATIGSRRKTRRGILSSHDEVLLGRGLVSRAVVNALLEPLADICWDTPARDFLIQLLQESCVLVKVAVEPPRKGEPRRASAGGGGLGQPHPSIPRSLSFDNGMMARASSYGSEQEGYSYFIPCILPTAQPEWRFNWVTRVHCGRRWRFHRFVPPSLMSALICRFYEMAKPGSAWLSRGSILIKVPLGHGSTGRRMDAELFLILYRGRPSRRCSRLELWAQVMAGYHDAMMQRLQSFVEVIDKTLGEFPGLLVNCIVPCPACMEREPSKPTHWGELPVETVEEYRSCAGDLPSCNENCRLYAMQKRLMFVGERPHDIADTNAQWDSPLPELGSGLRVPRVNSLYPAICPIAVYDCENRCFACQATAFVVDAEKGLLLTAAHTFLQPKKSPDGTRPHWDECRKENCVILVAMLQPPYQYDTRWEFVADAVQHSSFVRRAAYDDIGWKMDHPVLLRIKKRFDPVPIRDDFPMTFKNITSEWRRPPDKDTRSRNPDAHPESGLTELRLGESRMLHRPLDETDQTDRLMLQRPEALLELQRPEAMGDVYMSMTVFPQELLTLIGWPNHLYPNYSSICVTQGPVARNIVAQDVMEVLLSNNDGASGGPLVDTRGEVVGILSQANLTSAYAMGITTAKTILKAEAQDLEKIYDLKPL